MNSHGADNYFKLEGWGSAQINISVPIVQFLPVIVPPYFEQTAIVTYLDRETAKIDKLIEKIEAAIERLQEYRTALITAAVTGKICVTDKCKGGMTEPRHHAKGEDAIAIHEASG